MPCSAPVLNLWLGSHRLKKATAITSGVLLKKLFNMLNNDKHRNKGFAKEAILGGQNPADQSVQHPCNDVSSQQQPLRLWLTVPRGLRSQAAGGEQSEGRVERPGG